VRNPIRAPFSPVVIILWHCGSF